MVALLSLSPQGFLYELDKVSSVFRTSSWTDGADGLDGSLY